MEWNRTFAISTYAENENQVQRQNYTFKIVYFFPRDCKIETARKRITVETSTKSFTRLGIDPQYTYSILSCPRLVYFGSLSLAEYEIWSKSSHEMITCGNTLIWCISWEIILTPSVIMTVISQKKNKP